MFKICYCSRMLSVSLVLAKMQILARTSTIFWPPHFPPSAARFAAAQKCSRCTVVLVFVFLRKCKYYQGLVTFLHLCIFALSRRNPDPQNTKTYKTNKSSLFEAPRKPYFLIYQRLFKLFRVTHFPLTSTSRARPQKPKSGPTKKIYKPVYNKEKHSLGGSPQSRIF